jgi:hypothetical protein
LFLGTLKTAVDGDEDDGDIGQACWAVAKLSKGRRRRR